MAFPLAAVLCHEWIRLGRRQIQPRSPGWAIIFRREVTWVAFSPVSYTPASPQIERSPAIFQTLLHMFDLLDLERTHEAVADLRKIGRDLRLIVGSAALSHR